MATQIFVIFKPTWGRFPCWQAYFSKGLVQPVMVFRVCDFHNRPLHSYKWIVISLKEAPLGLAKVKTCGDDIVDTCSSWRIRWARIDSCVCNILYIYIHNIIYFILYSIYYILYFIYCILYICKDRLTHINIITSFRELCITMQTKIPDNLQSSVNARNF